MSLLRTLRDEGILENFFIRKSTFLILSSSFFHEAKRRFVTTLDDDVFHIQDIEVNIDYSIETLVLLCGCRYLSLS